MSTLTAAVSSSAVCQLYPSWTIGSIPTSKRNPCRSFSGGSSQTRLKPPPRAALVDAEPRSVPTLRDVSLQVPELAGNFVDDLQAEARAMARAANASVYSPQFLAAKYGSKPIKVVRRALLIIISLGSFGLKLFLDQGNGVLDKKRRLRATELRSIFTRLGPTFVKLGQGLSLRPDICPPEYLEELSELQNGLPTFPDDEAFSCIERELGQSLDSIFSSISPSSITAASLGQVYKAQLKYSGKLVAVKSISRAQLCAGSCWKDRMQGGLKKMYADKEDILAPDVFWDYTSSKVLTMEWVDGVKLNQQEAIDRQGLKVLDLVNTGIQCSLRQLLEYGYLHADPHPGNLLVTPEGNLAFLDFGMMSETPKEARFAVISHIVHLINRDYEAMACDCYALDFLSRDVDVSPIVPALQDFFDDALNYSVGELNFKTIVDGLGNVMYKYPFNVPAYYALILMSLTVLEGLALYSDPNFKVLAASYPYFAKRLLTDPNPYLRDALIELLFKDGRFRWNRLENLLVQGRKDRDFSAKEALQSVLKVLLSPEGEDLRTLVTKEVACVTESFILSMPSNTYKSVPEFLRSLVFNGNPNGPLIMSEAEKKSMIELRNQVLRIQGLLWSSEDFDPAVLLPILQVLQQPEARRLGGCVVVGITQRLAACFLQQVLLAPTTVST